MYDKWRGDNAGADDRPAGQRLGLHRPLDHVGVPVAGGGLHGPERRVPLGLRRHLPDSSTSSIPATWARGGRGEGPSACTALRLANADVCPLRYSDYAAAVQGYVDDLQQVEQQPGRRAGRPDAAARRPPGTGARRRAAWRRTRRGARWRGRHGRRGRALREINAALMRQERWLITPVGLPGRPWFRHQIYAPGHQHRLRRPVPAGHARRASSRATTRRRRATATCSSPRCSARPPTRGGPPGRTLRQSRGCAARR